MNPVRLESVRNYTYNILCMLLHNLHIDLAESVRVAKAN